MATLQKYPQKLSIYSQPKNMPCSGIKFSLVLTYAKLLLSTVNKISQGKRQLEIYLFCTRFISFDTTEMNRKNLEQNVDVC